MSSAFWLLLMGHFVGDFVFQTSVIAAFKSVKYKYLLIHSFIIFLSEFFSIAYSWLPVNILLVILLGIIHFLIDYIKFLKKNSFTKSGLYFLVDQALHVISIFLISNFIYGEIFLIPYNVAIIVIVCILNSYFSDILVYLFSNTSAEKRYERDYADYFFRGFSFLPFIINVYLGIIYLAAIGVVFSGIKRYGSSYFIKIIFSLSVNLLFIFLWGRFA